MYIYMNTESIDENSSQIIEVKNLVEIETNKIIKIADKKKDWKKSMWAILLTEFLGTIALTLWIILPSTMAFSTPAAHSNNLDFWNTWADIWNLMFMKALWAALFVVFIVYLLRPISVNLNPAVTIVEIGYGNDTLSKGAWKISVQIMGGICAGFIAYAIANSMGLWNPSDNPAGYHSVLDSVHPVWTRYNWGDFANGTYVVKDIKDMDLAGLFATSAFLAEILFTGILIGGVFLFPKVTHFWRPIVVGVGVWIAVALGIRFGSFSINPARMMGPAIAHDVMVSATGLNYSLMFTAWIPFYLLAQMIAAVSFALYGKKLRKAD